MRKTLRAWNTWLPIYKLQWGRTLSSAENIVSRTTRLTAIKLQWGRTLSSAENACHVYNLLLRSVASMGPHSFKCGKKGDGGFSAPIEAVLQWGRTLSSAEKCARRVIANPPWRGFNGAALFQVRKSVLRTASIFSSNGLQWGRTLSSAEKILDKVDSVVEARLLQWGRTLSSAEKGSSVTIA